MHAGHRRLVSHPPSGYEIVTARTAQEHVFDTLTRSNVLRSLLRSSDAVLPTGLVKSALEGLNKPPAGTVLTYACDHLVFRGEPWIVEVEFASLLAGVHPKHLKRFSNIITRTLRSRYCRKIICWSETGRRGLLADLDAQAFGHKIAVVPYTVPPRPGHKTSAGQGVKLIFVGADALGSSWRAFEYKGGREVLSAFALLCDQFANLELVVRARVPPDMSRQYQSLPGLRIIEEYIPWEQLDFEYRTADICVLPSHTTIPVTILEAMSYGLPVVTINSWANAEYVEDGKTGLVAPRSTRLPYFYANTGQVNFGTPEYDRAIQTPDPLVVEELVWRLRMLIQSSELRRKLSHNAKWEVEHGRFSLGSVNQKLKALFDEAISDEPN
jgi:glycosyltransferase involved in cell wall biosynthesis